MNSSHERVQRVPPYIHIASMNIAHNTSASCVTLHAHVLVGRSVGRLVGRECWKIMAIEMAILCTFGYFVFHESLDCSHTQTTKSSFENGTGSEAWSHASHMQTTMFYFERCF